MDNEYKDRFKDSIQSQVAWRLANPDDSNASKRELGMYTDEMGDILILSPDGCLYIKEHQKILFSGILGMIPLIDAIFDEVKRQVGGTIVGERQNGDN